MKGENAAVASTKVNASSKMSEFFRHGSVEERRAVYLIAANVAINEQKDVIRSVKSGEFLITKRK